MSDLLKEAIADAKAVRETALLNAKAALEEAFTPQLKNMLSAKLKEDEYEDEEEAIPGEEVPLAAQDEIPGEEIPGEVPGEEVPLAAQDAIPGEEIPGEEDDLDLEAIIRELEAELGGEEEVVPVEEPVDETMEINGIRYQPIKEEDDAYDKNIGKTDASHLAEEDDAYDENVENVKNPESGEGNGMDGVPALKQEGEGDEDEEVEVDESIFLEQEDEEEETVEENNDVSSGVGNGDNVQPATKANSAQTEDPGDSTDVEDMDGVPAIKSESVKSLRSQLKEYRQAVTFLKDKLHEVNILNAKLLFTNKLFKAYSLNNNQKLKVVETFDRAQTTREIKLVYSTLAEQFGDNGSIARKKSINESASSKAGSTKPSKESRKVITEETQVADRFRKLAGLIK